MQQSQSNAGVKRRRVFYIPGYDPFHPRRYRELYRSECEKQAEISGYDIGIVRKEGDDTFGWHAAAKIGGSTVAADIDVLVWSDIVRSSMSSSVGATYWQLLRTVAIYVFSGTFRRLMWMRKGPVIAALYPIGVLLLQLLISILVGVVVVGIVEIGFGFLAGLVNLAFDFPWFVHWALIGAIAWMILRKFQALDHKIYAYYLMHDFAYTASAIGAYPEELEERLATFGDIIASAFNADVEEVLVVGHSSGAHLAISVLADLIREGRVPENGPKLGLLTLGHVVPMVSFLPKAQRLRADLAFLCNRDVITWVDVTAPGDGCSFALCDPVAVTGVGPSTKKWPIVFSAAFTQSLSPELWKTLKRRYFRLHFQYLCAFDRPKDYDYFQITCGPLTLAERYRGRSSSKSRIDVAASKFTSIE